MVNPVNHGRTAEALSRYRAEPYVVAADVYSRPPHNGRGGWTWYTGSAGWMYRVGIEALLGLTSKNGALHVDPCIPRSWKGYEAWMRTPHAEFHIVVDNAAGVSRGVVRIEVDGVETTARDIDVVGAVGAHHVRVTLGQDA
jgi:cellobiose phosphorylase